MAFEEIPLSQEEIDALGQGGAFYKFEAIGQKLVGRVVKISVEKNNFGKDETRMRVKHKNQAGAVTESIVVLNSSLKAQADKAQVQPGHAVMITYTSDKVIEGMAHPLKLFKFLVDKTPAAPGASAAKPPPPPPPPPAADDDIAF